MPYYRNPEWVGDAVRSVLAQTHRDLVLVVVGDGENPPLKVRDSRIIVYRLPENRGAYFAQQVVLTANPNAWYAPHAADDWSEPDHLERLVAYGTDTATGAVYEHAGDQVTIVRKVYEVGLFQTERLRGIGGYNPAERLGQDSLMLRLLRVTGNLAASDYPTYHRIQRAGSLCLHPDSRRGSPAREAMRLRNRAVARQCANLGIAGIKVYRESIVPPSVREEVAEHAARLAERMS